MVIKKLGDELLQEFKSVSGRSLGVWSSDLCGPSVAPINPCSWLWIDTLVSMLMAGHVFD